MKRVLLISPTPLNKIGGIETYEKYLINIINSTYPNCVIDIVVYESNKIEKNISPKINYYFSFLKNPNANDSYLKKIVGITKKFIKTRKLVYELNNENNYNLIIDSSFIYFKKFNKFNNYFLIQHFYLFNYIYSLFKKNKHRKFYDDFFQMFFLHKFNTLKKIKNFVVFDRLNAIQAKKYTHAKIWEIPMCGIDKFDYSDLDINNLKERNRIAYLGRINNTWKRVNLLMKINEYINLIDFYGNSSNPDENKILNELINQSSYKGFLNSKDDIKNKISKYKFTIIYSISEGFPFSLVESLSLGVPIIVKNTFTSASFLCNKETGLLLDANNSLEKDIELIKTFYNMNLEQYKNLCESCLKFYKENLSFDNFSTRWKEIFKLFL